MPVNIMDCDPEHSEASYSGPFLAWGSKPTVNGSVVVLTLLLFLATNGCGGTASNQSTTQSLPLVLTAMSSNLNFGTVAVGTTSAPQNVTLTASNGSVSVSNITVQEPFQVASVSLPAILGSNQSLTVQISFAPTTAGSVTLANGLRIVSDATNSPNNISLSGIGSTGGTSACVGSAITQIPQDVTSQLSSVGVGITVTQVTSATPLGGSWNSYADVLAYSSPAKLMVYNYGTNPAGVASANLDGTNAQLISSSAQGTQVQMTVDGQFAYYQGQNSNGTADIYAVPISQSGNCQQIRLSQLNMTFVAPAQALIISTSSIDATGHNVIAFSEGTQLHRVRDDGTALPDLTLGDSEDANVFHRMRLNPVFPNVLWYKRDQPAPNPNGVAEPEIWVVDLQSPNTVYSVTGSIAADHDSWSKDGTQLGYIDNGLWHVADVLKSDGSFNVNSSGSFTLTDIGPPSSSGFSVDFCNLSPDGSVYVCAESYKAVYLMSLDGSQTKFLASPDSSPTGAIYNGIPKPSFLDMQHIIFSSDRTGTPQVYVITGFTTTFP
jgi:hypothetical protein